MKCALRWFIFYNYFTMQSAKYITKRKKLIVEVVARYSSHSNLRSSEP
jgi:hypothetical protein